MPYCFPPSKEEHIIFVNCLHSDLSLLPFVLMYCYISDEWIICSVDHHQMICDMSFVIKIHNVGCDHQNYLAMHTVGTQYIFAHTYLGIHYTVGICIITKQL